MEMKNKQLQEFYSTFSKHLHVFEGCQNMLGVVPLTLAGYQGGDQWKKDPKLRGLLTDWGKSINSDSVMILTGYPIRAEEQGYHVEMEVFEPNGDDGSGLGGGISTMCGNGVRAVAAYVMEFLPDLTEVRVMTMSGLRKIKVEKNSEGVDMYIVDMGEFTTRLEDLSSYVETDKVIPNSEGKYIDSPIPEEIRLKLAEIVDVNSWSIGVNGDRDASGRIDGEPHLIIEVPRDQVEDIADLRRIAVAVGPIITKHSDLFPEEMNTNFIVRDGVDGEGRFVIWNCTHERNLGNDADHSVTAACGTGSTVAGGLMFEKYVQDPSQIILVKCTGGDLEIAKNGLTSLLMKGPAQRVK
mgnify:CR=1 FL=1